jgi:hypothetical protein
LNTQITRRELFLKKLPKLALLVAGVSATFNSTVSNVLAEPISRKRSCSACVRSLGKSTCSDEFIRRLFLNHYRAYLSVNENEFQDFCKKNNLNVRNRRVRREYVIAKLLHDLVRHGGILGNRYELVEYRKKNIRKMTSKGLAELGDDAKERYPAKMMRDLFSSKPRYVAFPDKKLYSFGDCDELEMLYVTLLRYMGLKAKVVMTASNHVETLVRIGGKEFLVDNSFSKFGRPRKCKGRCRNWMTGKVGYTDWRKAKVYIDLVNKRARANAKIIVTEEAVTRITNAILSEFK